MVLLSDAGRVRCGAVLAAGTDPRGVVVNFWVVGEV